MKTCSVEDCQKSAPSRGLMCSMHRNRLRRRGTVDDLKPKNCDYCGSLYQPGKSNSKTCSNKCSQAMWREANREYNVARAMKWNKENPDKISANMSRYYWKNPELSRAKGRESYRKQYSNNPERFKLAFDRRRALLLNAPTVEFSQNELEQRWEYYCSKCYLCGKDAVATDHVKPLTKGGAHMLCNLRPICKSCNSSKGAKWPYDLSFRGASSLAI